MNFQIPVEHLFTVRLEGLAGSGYAFDGPFGARRFEKAAGGTVSGAAMTGRVLELLATDYGRVSGDGTIRAFNASVTLQADDGTIVLMQYRGRSSPAYGQGQSRIQVLFQAPDGACHGLNEVQAIGYGRLEGDATVFEVYGLTCQPGAEGPDDARPWRQRQTVAGKFLFRRRSAHVPGNIRHVLQAPLGTRYFTLAEGGGAFAGPRLKGDFVSGFSWGPHRTVLKAEGGYGVMQYDMETLLKSDDGAPILMSYTGVSSDRYPKGSWMTAILFETAPGPHDWLNEIQAIGFGQWMGDGSQYDVYALV